MIGKSWSQAGEIPTSIQISRRTEEIGKLSGWKNVGVEIYIVDDIAHGERRTGYCGFRGKEGHTRVLYKAMRVIVGLRPKCELSGI